MQNKIHRQSVPRFNPRPRQISFPVPSRPIQNRPRTPIKRKPFTLHLASIPPKFSLRKGRKLLSQFSVNHFNFVTFSIFSISLTSIAKTLLSWLLQRDNARNSQAKAMPTLRVRVFILFLTFCFKCTLLHRIHGAYTFHFGV